MRAGTVACGSPEFDSPIERFRSAIGHTRLGRMPTRTRHFVVALVVICVCGVLAGCGVAASRPVGLALAGLHQERKGVGNARASSSPAPFRFFSPTSFWNRELPVDIPLDPASVAVVGAFDEEIAAELEAKDGPWIDTTTYSFPVYTVPATQPTVRVTLDGDAPALQAAWDAVPLPATAVPAVGTDHPLILWQPSTDRLWEFHRLVHEAAGWSASGGGAMQNVLSNPGVYGPEAWPGAATWWGLSSSSLSKVGGLISLEDLELGQINHALEMAIPNVRGGVYASPAQRTDGKSTDLLALPEGAHLRLNPNLNLAALHLPRLTLMIAEAAQRYGIFITDGAGNVTLYAQDPIPTGTEPYSGPDGYFEGKYPSQLLASFPWHELELLKMELHSTKVPYRRRCSTPRRRRAAKCRRKRR